MMWVAVRKIMARTTGIQNSDKTKYYLHKACLIHSLVKSHCEENGRERGCVAWYNTLINMCGTCITLNVVDARSGRSLLFSIFMLKILCI